MSSAESPPKFHLQRPCEDVLVGRVVNGKYRVLSVVATGGMGRIYRAEQLPLNRIVALKVLNPQYTASTEDEAFQKRFFLEASILSKLQHPNIVTVFDYGSIEDTDPEAYFMAMEFLAGSTLHNRLAERGPLSPQEALGLTRQIARGLREAHAHDVVHRDLKPSNVMLVPKEDGTELVKIVDFGLVKVLTDDSDQVTKEGTFLGSPRYMSPEQISHGRVDLRTDVYSLGVILYQVLCGVPPFDSSHAVQTLMAHLHDPVPWIETRCPGVRVPEPLEVFVRRCLEKDPDLRPANMEEFTRSVGELEAELGYVGTGSAFDQDTGSGNRSLGFEARAEARASTALHLARSEQPTVLVQAPRRPSALPVLLTVAGVVLVLILGGLTLYRNRHNTTAQTSSVSSVPTAQETRARFVLSLDSVPTGASVLEADTVLGTTPLQLTLDREELRAKPRLLSLRLQGYQPYSLVQGPSEENLRILAPLLAVPSASPSVALPATAAPVRAAPVPGSAKAGASKAESSKPPDSDIRLTR